MKDLNELIKQLAVNHASELNWPSVQEVDVFLQHTLGFLFPGLGTKIPAHEKALNDAVAKNRELLERCLVQEVIPDEADSTILSNNWLNGLPGLYTALILDAQAIETGDPAAQSISEVIRTYPGFYAIACYRIANSLKQLGVRYVPRMITELAHSRTGIDIHPGAVIGKSFFIDHGTGIVIGETTVIGDEVKIYQGVTLGALSVQKQFASVKRHPTIENKVVIYAGATILGGDTVVGEKSVIGGNCWVTESVASGSTVLNHSEIRIKTQKKNVTID